MFFIKKIKHFLYSLTVHFLFFLVLLSENFFLISQKKGVFNVNVDYLGGVSKSFFLEKGDGDKNCQKFYGGIGIKYSGQDFVVSEVAPGYAADRAGIKPGDIVYADNIRGEIGKVVVIKLSRNGVFFYKTLVTEKICLK